MLSILDLIEDLLLLVRIFQIFLPFCVFVCVCVCRYQRNEPVLHSKYGGLISVKNVKQRCVQVRISNLIATSRLLVFFLIVFLKSVYGCFSEVN